MRFTVPTNALWLRSGPGEVMVFGGSVHLTDLPLTAGVHTITLTYPRANLTPGSAETRLTTLAGMALEPLDDRAPTRLRVAPADAGVLCGRPLDWIDVIA